jgi:predicted peroxiredoxin
MQVQKQGKILVFNIECKGLEKEVFVDGIEVGGAKTFLQFAKDADVTLTF